MKIQILILAFLTKSLTLFAQKNQTIEQEILNADSILFVTHKATDGFVIINDSTNEKKYPDRVVVNGVPNYSVITQRILVSNISRHRLVDILKIKGNDRLIKTCMTFIPFHAILIFKNSICSYIDISFGCNSILVPSFQEAPFTIKREKTKKLESLFESLDIETK
mgnify:CR=1 FL=1